MSDHYFSPLGTGGTYFWPNAPRAESQAGASLANMAVVGAIVGGAAAAARNVRRLHQDEIDFGTAVARTGRAVVASGLATAVAGAVAGAVADHGALRLSVMFGVGVATLYGLSTWAEGKEGRNA
ncbi:MAG: hypothetical protein WBP72_02390 [Rhodocyclaceae bacterium]